jgi:hypothetical protein
MRHVLALLIGCALTFHVGKAAVAPPIAAHSFRQLQSQAGDWRGTGHHGQAIRYIFSAYRVGHCGDGDARDWHRGNGHLL